VSFSAEHKKNCREFDEDTLERISIYISNRLPIIDAHMCKDSIEGILASSDQQNVTLKCSGDIDFFNPTRSKVFLQLITKPSFLVQPNVQHTMKTLKSHLKTN
jgi:hypothetical protein